MALVATRITVDNTEDTLLATAPGLAAGSSSPINVRNRGTVAVFLGGAGVLAADGYQLDPGESVGWALAASDTLHAITAAGSAVVHVLKGA